MSEYLPSKTSPTKRPIREITENLTTDISQETRNAPEYNGPPIEVEGSTEYLRIILPSSELPGYKEVLSLLREWNFLRDRSHRHWWWLRDPSKVLDFLASHQEDLELDYDAQFTENFKKLTKVISRASLRAKATESESGTTLEVTIEAGDTPIDEIEHALSTGQNHIRHGTKVYLLTKELKDKANQIQKRITGDMDAPLLSQFSHAVEKYQATSLEEFIISADPRFKPPAEWIKRCKALKDLGALPPPLFHHPWINFCAHTKRLGWPGSSTSFRNQLGGILADEMGLGKTLQALAFLSALKKKKDQACLRLWSAPPRWLKTGGERHFVFVLNSKFWCITAAPGHRFQQA